MGRYIEGIRDHCPEGNMHCFTQDLTLLGNVVGVDGGSFTLRCRSGDEFTVRLGRETVCAPVTNVDNEPRDRVADPPGFVGGDPAALVRKYVDTGRLLAAEGVYHEQGDSRWLDARTIT